MFGYNDLALGYFTAEENLLESCERVIIENWVMQYSEGEQQHWESLWRTGILDADRVSRMAT